MAFIFKKILRLAFVALAFIASTPTVFAQEKVLPKALPSLRDEPMVEVSAVCPAIVIELRYAGMRNVTGQPIYPPGARCLLRRSVAERLKRAQAELETRKLGLKICCAHAGR